LRTNTIKNCQTHKRCTDTTASVTRMTSTWATGQQHQITFGEQSAWITEVGATLRSYADAKGEMIDGVGPDEPISAGRGQTLMPWPNRVKDGKYTFNGKNQQLPITEVPKNNSSHGLLRWVNWQLVERSAASITLAVESHPQPGYPHSFTASMIYALSANGLEVRMDATNSGPSALPFGMGSHPYFTTGTDSVDVNTLTCHAAQYLESDEQAIPTRAVAVDATTDFCQTRALKGEPLNLCYLQLGRDSNGRANIDVLRNDGDGGVRVWMDSTFDYVMVYTGDDVPQPERQRKGIAIEPMTCAPDAFNNGMGLVTLQPGETISGVWGVSRM
jgi:aldose 1-epimerase